MNAIPIIGTLGHFTASKKAPGACINCKWSTHEQSDLVCRRNPPSVSILMVPGKFANTLQPQSMAAFPVVKPEMWCGEFGIGLLAPKEGEP